MAMLHLHFLVASSYSNMPCGLWAIWKTLRPESVAQNEESKSVTPIIYSCLTFDNWDTEYDVIYIPGIQIF